MSCQTKSQWDFGGLFPEEATRRVLGKFSVVVIALALAAWPDGFGFHEQTNQIATGFQKVPN
jgi:hypothetical protein